MLEPGADDGFREFLCHWIRWIHQDSDDASGSASSYLSPVMVYLQKIIWVMSMEQWAVGVIDSSKTPLGIAWEWARTSPAIGRKTADVAALVIMGCRIEKYMLRSRLWFAPEEEEVGIWETVWAAGSRLLNIRPRSSAFGYDPVPEPAQERDIEAERQAAMHSVRLLRAAGERHSQLLGTNNAAQERVEVDCIRSWTELIAGKAAPLLVPDSVLQLIPSLGKTGAA